MLPQADAHILKANPEFARLYKDLAANKLNTDGSSQIVDPKDAKTRDIFAAELQNARVKLARKRLLIEGLRHVAYNLTELPDEVFCHDQYRSVPKLTVTSSKIPFVLFLHVSKADWAQETMISSTQKRKPFTKRSIHSLGLCRTTFRRSLHHLRQSRFQHNMVKRRTATISRIASDHCWKA